MKNLFEDALESFNQKDYKNAIKLFELAAEDNVEALFYLGVIYRKGLGVLDNQKIAFDYFLDAATKGHIESQFIVGSAYLGSNYYGDDEYSLLKIDQLDLETKFLNDDSTWQDYFIYIHLEGIGVEPDDSKAFYWIEKAALNSHVPAQVALGEMYAIGSRVEENEEKALYWFNKAMENNSTAAMRKLAGNDNYETLASRIELLKKAYELSDYRAAYSLAKKYAELEDYKNAIEWYIKSSMENKNYEAELRLGDFYFNGIGVVKNNRNAKKWYDLAKETYKLYSSIPLTRAYEKLYEIYLESEELFTENELLSILKVYARYDEDCFNLLRKYHDLGYKLGPEYQQFFSIEEQAEKGDYDSQVEFGYAYIINKNQFESIRQKAINWYFNGAIKGDSNLQYLIAKSYGLSDLNEHNRWLELSANSGYDIAIYEIGNKYKDIDNEKYINNLKKAAKTYIYAKLDLAYYLAHGIYVDIDYLESYKLYHEIATEMKYTNDKNELYKLNYIKLKYNAANDKVSSLANNGDINAQLYMGVLYQYGFEVKRNLDRALYYYKLAKKQGSQEAEEQIENIIAELNV